MKLNDRVYDVLKWCSLYILPAIAVFYCTIAKIWGLPYCEQVVDTVTAIETLIGVILGVSTYEYKKENKEP